MENYREIAAGSGSPEEYLAGAYQVETLFCFDDYGGALFRRIYSLGSRAELERLLTRLAIRGRGEEERLISVSRAEDREIELELSDDN